MCKYCEENDNKKIIDVIVDIKYENPNAYGYPDVAYWHKKYKIKHCPFCGRKIESIKWEEIDE